MPAADHDIAAVRRFSRFYTREIGLLQNKFLQSPFSLTEGRVLYELSRRDKMTASALAEELGLDPGYLSRILRGFEQKGFIVRARAVHDGRQSFLSLTAKGRKAFAPLDRGSHAQVGAMLQRISVPGQKRVVAAMGEIENLLKQRSTANAGTDRRSFVLRKHRPGDMGWVVTRHATVYAEEYGWNAHIEAITAEIVGAFLKNYDPKCECCWIAEMDGEPMGSVFLVREDDKNARLRLLIVDPKGRGLGIGRKLTEESIAFARKAGYRKIVLWTHANLTAARTIYRQAGFQLTAEWVHDDFGKPEAAETWELKF